MCRTCGCEGPREPPATPLVDLQDVPAAGAFADRRRLERHESRLLARNDALAAENRARLHERGVLALNLVSSPGAGKTTLLERTIRDLAGRFPVAVIEGDQATDHDAARIRATGAPVVQINTGQGCHLDASMVARALDALAPPEGAVLFIENVGNLVCPALFDLGERAKVVLASVTEGEDKPLKYPHIFRASALLLLSKCDLLPHLRFDADRCLAHAREVQPAIETLRISSETGQGLEGWYNWLEAREMSQVEREAAMHVPVEEGEEALRSRLEGLAGAAEQALGLLAEMGAALFPSGQPDLSKLTWGERGEAGEPASAEERLRQTELRFRTLIEQIPAVTFLAVLGEGKNEIYISPHIEQLLGYGQREWLADPFLWYARLHPDDRAVWNEEFARGCRTGGPFRADCRFLARDGHAVWVHGEARLVKDERGRPLFLQGVAFDITDIKRAQHVLLEEAVQRAKAEEEMAIARRVQLSILPRSFEVEGLEIAARMEPASDVGGDYYDVLPAPGGAWLAVGDVSGHGLSSGLIMLMLQSAMAAIVKAHAGATPREVLCLVNDVLYENIRKRLRGDDHITLSLLRYERSGRLVFAGAHEDILVHRRRTGRVEMIRPPGTWIGARRDISSVTVNTTIALEDGDLVVLYTDGATEAMDARGRQFDIDRLVAAIQEVRAEPPARVVEHVFAAVRAWMREQADDISVLAFRYRAPS